MQQLKAADLRPSEVWASLDDRAHRAWARTVKYYENLKFVYQIQTLLRDWQQQEEDQKATEVFRAKDGRPEAAGQSSEPRESAHLNTRLGHRGIALKSTR